MTSFGSRLKEERLRLRLSQKAMADLAGVSKSSQVGYEGDAASPPQDYLAHLWRNQVDVRYLLIGEYANTGESPELAETAALLNQLPPAQKAMAFAVISLFQNVPGAGGGGTEQTADIWRAARLFGKFLKASPEGKDYIEKAAEIDDVQAAP